MPYIAQKPCRFDKEYAIGMMIPDSVIDPKREKDLIAMKLIVKISPPVAQEGTPAPEAVGSEAAQPETAEPVAEPEAVQPEAAIPEAQPKTQPEAEKNEAAQKDTKKKSRSK